MHLDRVAQAAGAWLVLVTLADVFFTVLFPASGKGPVRKPVGAAVWWLFGAVRWVRDNDRRRRILCYGGPVHVTSTLLSWLTLLFIGWGALYWPALGRGVAATSGTTDHSWTTALYVSGYTLTTLGTGDVVATTGLYRLLQVAEAAAGFAVVTLVISYFITVYTTLPPRNAFAMALHHWTGGTDCPAHLVLRNLDDPAALRHRVEQLGSHLRELAQTHRSYPVLRYFHYREDYYSLTRILYLAFECLSLVSAVRPGQELVREPLVEEVRAAARSVVAQFVDLDGPTPARATEDALAVRHWGLLAQAEPSRYEGKEDAFGRYLHERTQWQDPMRMVARHLLYEPWPPACGCQGR